MLDVKNSYVIHTSQINAEIEFLGEQAADDLPMNGVLPVRQNFHVFLLHALLIIDMSIRAVLKTPHMAASRLHGQDYNQDNWSFHIVFIDCL